jgi:hypothetical protein
MHRAGGWSIRPEHGRYIAGRIPGARYPELPGAKHFLWEDDMDRGITETQEFVTGVRPEAFVDRVLATVMMTDLVDSTDHAARMSDPNWKHLIERHNRIVQVAVEQARGNYLRSTGRRGRRHLRRAVTRGALREGHHRRAGQGRPRLPDRPARGRDRTHGRQHRGHGRPPETWRLYRAKIA